ncbi:MAG: cobalamin biosynthesis protein CbiM [Candidatus Melainabacteria bacterium GWF2_32_7]|nr:MAG: cobalamin biosynthesis protein CbiM [Candidatus Melainabacteria bacterium GWF2_32_7]OGI21981.1 MAG: cobalamin biosynthesis protein CbiM [Candidatus Melainabacteria bacterium RIFOXYA2_FULL_32_9]
MFKIKSYFLISLAIILFLPQPVFAMHIMEGFLPLKWCVFWSVLSLPFLIAGLISIQKITNTNPKLKMLIALAGAFTFVLSALKLPSVTGSSSHPTGVGFGSILFGPIIMTVLSSIVLLFQALLLAHGGITTLGANIFSMGVVGPFIAFGIYKLFSKFNSPRWLCIFLAAALGNLTTYITTSFQLALAFPSPTGGFELSFIKFMGVFALTQIPLAISEGLLTVLIFNFLSTYNLTELMELNVLADKNPNSKSEET